MNPVREGTWNRRRWLALLLLPLLVAAALYLPGIGRRTIYAGDEARYAILARTMLYGWVWTAMAVALAGAILLPFRQPPEWAVLVPPTLAQKLAVVGLLLAGALLVIAAAQAGRVLATFAAVFVPVLLMLALLTRVAVTGHNRAFDVRSLSERLAARAGAQDDLVTYRYHPLPIQFYSGRAIARVGERADLKTRAEAGRRLYVVVEDFAWPDLVATGPGWTVVDSADVNGIRVLVGTPAAHP